MFGFYISMHVGKVSNYRYKPQFTRRLRDDEKPEYRAALTEAKEYLGLKNVSMIIHGSCYPADSVDTGVGSPFSKAAEELIKFEKLHGFDGNQLGPNGEVSRAFISPYSGTVFAKNHLFIDLNALTTDDYANILPKSTLDKLKLSEPIENIGKPYTYSKFFDAFEIYDYAIREAYTNFCEKIAANDEKALELNQEFNEFRNKKGKEALKESLFQVLSHTYETMDPDLWENETDRDLIALIKERDPEAIARLKQIVTRSSDDIDAFTFGQFLIHKQIKENKEFRDKEHFIYINDLLVGFSPSEKWIYKDAFLKDYEMGCPFGGAYGPQLWKIPVLDPKKLFNSDGSLGSAGKLLKNKIETAFETGENVRIDHALGLVDPYIYDKNSVHISNGQLDWSRFRGNNISNMPSLDPDENYKKLLGNLVLPLLKEHGVNPENAVWEDLVCATDTFKQVYYAQHNLPGMTVLEGNRGENSPRRNITLIGSHDSEPVLKMLKRDWIPNHYAWNVDYLAGYLNADPVRNAEREEFKQKIISNPLELMKAKFIELFSTADNIQISFADFFGIDKVYNHAGTQLSDNWKLRLNENYEDMYYKNLESDNPTALNIPEILKGAVQAKMDLEIVRSGDNIDSKRKEMYAKLGPLLDTLNKYAGILKEKS